MLEYIVDRLELNPSNVFLQGLMSTCKGGCYVCEYRDIVYSGSDGRGDLHHSQAWKGMSKHLHDTDLSIQTVLSLCTFKMLCFDFVPDFGFTVLSLYFKYENVDEREFVLESTIINESS